MRNSTMSCLGALIALTMLIAAKPVDAFVNWVATRSEISRYVERAVLPPLKAATDADEDWRDFLIAGSDLRRTRQAAKDRLGVPIKTPGGLPQGGLDGSPAGLARRRLIDENLARGGPFRLQLNRLRGRLDEDCELSRVPFRRRALLVTALREVRLLVSHSFRRGVYAQGLDLLEGYLEIRGFLLRCAPGHPRIPLARFLTTQMFLLESEFLRTHEAQPFPTKVQTEILRLLVDEYSPLIDGRELLREDLQFRRAAIRWVDRHLPVALTGWLWGDSESHLDRLENLIDQYRPPRRAELVNTHPVLRYYWPAGRELLRDIGEQAEMRRRLVAVLKQEASRS